MSLRLHAVYDEIKEKTRRAENEGAGWGKTTLHFKVQTVRVFPTDNNNYVNGPLRVILTF